MANDGRTPIATLFCHQMPPLVLEIGGIQWQRLEKRILIFWDGKSIENDFENKPNGSNGEKRKLRNFLKINLMALMT